MATKRKRLNQQDREWLYSKAIEHTLANGALVYAPPGTTRRVLALGDYQISFETRKVTPNFSDITRVKLVVRSTLLITTLRPPVRNKFLGVYDNQRLITMKCHSNRACREIMDILLRDYVLDELAQV